MLSSVVNRAKQLMDWIYLSETVSPEHSTIFIFIFGRSPLTYKTSISTARDERALLTGVHQTLTNDRLYVEPPVPAPHMLHFNTRDCSENLTGKRHGMYIVIPLTWPMGHLRFLKGRH